MMHNEPATQDQDSASHTTEDLLDALEELYRQAQDYDELRILGIVASGHATVQRLINEMLANVLATAMAASLTRGSFREEADTYWDAVKSDMEATFQSVSGRMAKRLEE